MTPRDKKSTTTAPYGELIEPTTFRIVRLLPGPIDLVWAFLTESEKRGQWFCSGEMELREGGTFTMHFQHCDLSHEKDYPDKYKQFESGHDATATVSKCEPPRLLGFLWGEGEEASEITFELSEEGDQVRLVLTNTRLHDPEEQIGTAAGWHGHFDILEDILSGRERRGFWSNHTQLEAKYAEQFKSE
jgi:uncharacterized protein YndB with AHSA1/START domain